MQDLLQGLQNAREIVASGPVVMEEIQRQLMAVESPLERMMLLRNIQFRITRRAPDSGRRGRNSATPDFGAYRQVRTKSNYV